MIALTLRVIRRELLLNWRSRTVTLSVLLFFVLASSLFPLGVGPDPKLLHAIAPGVLWVTALFAALLSAGQLFSNDFASGALEQMLLSPQPLAGIVLGKIAAHWITTGLALEYGLDARTILMLMASLLIGTPLLSLIGSMGAALTLGVRGGSVVLALLILPLYVPVLVFGVGAADPAASAAWANANFAARGGVVHRAMAVSVRERGGPAHIDGIAPMNWFRYASARNFERFAARATPWFAFASVVFIAMGLVIGLGVAPADALQRDIYRIMFVHVPAAWMSMLIYLVMAAYSALHLAMNARLCAMMARALAPTGASFTAIALISGALWGKPTGHMVGLGRAAHVGVDPVLPVRRLSRAARGHRRHPPRRSRVLGARADRRRECPDHLFFRAMVVHAASRTVARIRQRRRDGNVDGLGHRRDDGGILVVCDRRGVGARARHPARGRTRARERRASVANRGACRMNTLASVPTMLAANPLLCAAFAITFLLMGAEAWLVHRALRR